METRGFTRTSRQCPRSARCLECSEHRLLYTNRALRGSDVGYTVLMLSFNDPVTMKISYGYTSRKHKTFAILLEALGLSACGVVHAECRCGRRCATFHRAFILPLTCPKSGQPLRKANLGYMWSVPYGYWAACVNTVSMGMATLGVGVILVGFCVQDVSKADYIVWWKSHWECLHK